MLFLAFNNSLILFAYVLLFLKVPNGPVVPWLPIVAALAAGSAVCNRVLMARPLDCSSTSALVGSYRTRFFSAIAVSESVALFAFLFTFIGAPKWTYDVGAAFSLWQLWTVEPPTRAAFARLQARLDASGCTLSLYDAFRGHPPQPPAPNRG
jgi:hypothetical protein